MAETYPIFDSTYEYEEEGRPGGIRMAFNQKQGYFDITRGCLE
jgi:hypothetical protein